jgi:hypothetical protein
MPMHRGLATMGRFGCWAKPTALDHGPNLAQALFTGVSFFFRNVFRTTTNLEIHDIRILS